MKNATNPQRSQRRLFKVGRIVPKTKQVCSYGNHYGHLLRAEVYDEFGQGWEGMGECSQCKSTIHKSQLRRVG